MASFFSIRAFIYFDPICSRGKMSQGPGGKGRCRESGNENERMWERLRFTGGMKYDGDFSLSYYRRKCR